MTISIGDMKLYGLDNFTVEYLKVTNTFDNIRLSVKLFVPALSIFSDNYKLKGRAYYLYPLQGLGKMSASLHKVDASLSVNFANVGDVSMRLDNFELNLGFGSVEVDLENSSWPINQVLNKEGVEILKSLHDDIVNSINSYAVPYANEYLAKITYKEFLDIVTIIGDSSYVISKNIK
ncbi:uncharacterized protein LOC112043273 isoform X2 [Bicyclus anynana]|nr:uncharacterized protein LOC112043273 isoform X2 [Bicyclus anynana]